MDSPQTPDLRDPDPRLDFEPEPEARDAPDGASTRPAAPARQNPWPRRAVAVLAVALIGGAIWFLQRDSEGGAGLPAGQDGATLPADGFVSFESQGVRLGAAGGPPPAIGRPAPDFTLLDVDGRSVSLSGFRGSTVVVNFWATWCPPCRKEFPELVRLYDQNAGRGLVVLGVDLQESAGIVQRFADEFGATFPIVIDRRGEVATQYRLRGLPLTVFVDAEGVLRAQHVGQLTGEILERKLADAGFSITRSE